MRLALPVQPAPHHRLPTVVVGLVALGILGLFLGDSACSRQIDWVDFVQVGNVQYLGGIAGGRQLTTDDLGPEQTKVRFKVYGSILAPRYRPNDGDAAFLDAGTPLYAVKNYAPSFRLAVSVNGVVKLYEAIFNSGAKVGSDLLDISGKVTAIEVHPQWSDTPGSSTPTPTTITDPERVTRIAEMIVRAPVVGLRAHALPTGRAIPLVFDLSDGTTTRSAYFPDAGRLGDYIAVPPEFRSALESA